MGHTGAVAVAMEAVDKVDEPAGAERDGRREKQIHGESSQSGGCVRCPLKLSRMPIN